MITKQYTMVEYDKKTLTSDNNMPDNFDQHTVRTITRIEANPRVIGLMFFRNNFVQMCTLPVTISQTISSRLPTLTPLFQRAITEIVDFLILKDQSKVIMKIISNLLKDSLDEWLVKTTDTLNKVNPMVDRIMEDESVEGVIMTNKQGVPILTNINLVGATNYGIGMRNLGQMTQISAQEIDPFDEVLVLRILTKKIEVMVAPHREFNIIVIQHARASAKNIKTIKKKS